MTSTDKPITFEEMDARIMAVVGQRDAALNEVVLLRGRIAVMQTEINNLVAEKAKTPEA